MGVSNDKWKKKKNELLANFGIYYEYKVVTQGTANFYTIIRKFGEYLPPPKKGEKRDEIYQKGIIDIVAEDSLQTARNVARRLYLENYDILQLKHKEDTVYANTRANMRIMFGTQANGAGTMGTIMTKIWCRKDSVYNKYIKLTDEEVQNLYDLYKVEKESSREYELDILCDYENGLKTKEELYELIGNQSLNCFIAARQNYKAKYGFWPIKVPLYEFGAWDSN